MAANPWFRLYAEFATDPKVQMMSEAMQRRYIMLLCLRCSNGDVTLHDAEIAFQLRISDEEWSATKQEFAARKLIREDNQPGAWDKRQFTSDLSAERVSRHRAAKKRACNVTVTPPDTDTDTEKATIPTELSGPESRSTADEPGFELAAEQGAAKAKGRADPIPFQSIVETYNATLPGMPKVRELTPKRRALIRSAWTASPRRQTLAFWAAYFAECQDHPFLNGTGPYGESHTNWRPTFDYLLRADVVTRVFEAAMDRLERGQ